MQSILSLLAVLSLAFTTASSQSTWFDGPPPPFSPPRPPPGPPVLLTTTTEAWVVTCPAPATVLINVTETEYVPVAAPTTLPVTIYQTIISTTILTTTEVSISTTPTTATATEIISVYESTTQVTSVTLCPTRIVNPTYTALGPYPTDWTWGCPPGWLCKPVLDNCNMEVGLPDRNFLCSPNECIPAAELPATLPSWNTDIYGNFSPATDPSLRINQIDSYFNMNPEQFGLSYEIFVVNEVTTLTTTILLPPSPTVAARQAQTSIPGACYPWCNNCLLEAQSNGKTSALCVPGSAFEVSLEQCEQCIDYHKSDDSSSFVQIAPQFQQFLDYCDQFSTVVVSTTVTATTTNAAGSSLSVITGTMSTTVTPKSASAPSSISTSTRPSSVVTVVASTATVNPAPSVSISSTRTSVTSTLPTPSPSSSSASTPPAPVASEQPYVTTSTGLITSYSYTTIPPNVWSSLTIIMPVGNNVTTTMFGSDLITGHPTLVLPTSPSLSNYTTTMTVTPGVTTILGGQVSAASTGSSSAVVRPSSAATGAASAASSSASSSPAVFTGAAPALKLSRGEYSLHTALIGVVILLVTMFSL